MKNENNQKCDPCEQKFEKNVDKMVNDVEGYTSSDHKAREKEVDGAFGSKAQGQGQDNKNGQSYGNDRNSGSMGQDQKTQSYGSNGTDSMSQGQNSQNETWRQNTSANDPKSGQQYGSDRNSGSMSQGQSGQWKGNTSANDPKSGQQYGNNGGTDSKYRNESGKNFSNPTDRHEHAQEGNDAYARNTKTEGR